MWDYFTYVTGTFLPIFWLACEDDHLIFTLPQVKSNGLLWSSLQCAAACGLLEIEMAVLVGNARVLPFQRKFYPRSLFLSVFLFSFCWPTKWVTLPQLRLWVELIFVSLMPTAPVSLAASKTHTQALCKSMACCLCASLAEGRSEKVRTAVVFVTSISIVTPLSMLRLYRKCSRWLIACRVSFVLHLVYKALKLSDNSLVAVKFQEDVTRLSQTLHAHTHTHTAEHNTHSYHGRMLNNDFICYSNNSSLNEKSLWRYVFVIANSIVFVFLQ